MILEEETFKQFGYYPKNLKRGSSKRKILASCNGCGKIRITTKNSYKDFCRSCSQKGKKNPFYEKQHSEETKQKMKKNHIGMKSKHHTEESKKKMRTNHIGMIGKHHTEESKRKISNAKEGANIDKLRGKNNPMWKGGVSYEPYCIKFNNEFKERIREYWNRKCVICDKDEIENGRRMDVHHVDYNKDTCCDNSIPLFVALCMTCHHKKVHSNEAYWEKYFREMIFDKNSDNKCFIAKRK